MSRIKALQADFERQLGREVEKIGASRPANLYQPIRYTLDMGGKRLRPVMTLLACELFGGKAETAMPAALGIEIFHNFTLLHDDIMDHASMRRNQPTVHVKYGTNIAVLSGDAMSNLAYRYLLETASPALKEVLSLFTETALQVCEGQQMDMDYEDSLNVSISDYLNMIRLKTAVLMACSLKTGAILGSASARDADHLYEFGINLGMAFQLQDDLLDVYAREDQFGKKAGNDIVSNKKTFLLLKTIEQATAEQKQRLLSWIGRTDFIPEEKIAAVRGIYDETGIREITGEAVSSYVGKAISELDATGVEESRKDDLRMLTGKILKREK